MIGKKSTLRRSGNWGPARAPPRPARWRRLRLGTRSTADHRVEAIVLRPVRSVSAPAARADGGVGGGRGRVSVIPSRVCAAAGVYGNIWEYIMEGAFARCARARAIRSAAHSTARWVPPTRMRVEADARRGRRSMGRTSRVNRTVTEPTGSTGVPASSILFSQPRRHAPAPGQCSELDACATARTADAKSPHFPRQEVRAAAQSGVSTRWRAASALKNENVMTQQRLAFDALNSRHIR